MAKTACSFKKMKQQKAVKPICSKPNFYKSPTKKSTQIVKSKSTPSGRESLYLKKSTKASYDYKGNQNYYYPFEECFLQLNQGDHSHLIPDEHIIIGKNVLVILHGVRYKQILLIGKITNIEQKSSGVRYKIHFLGYNDNRHDTDVPRDQMVAALPDGDLG